MSTKNKFARLAFDYTPNPRRAKDYEYTPPKSRKGERARIATLPKEAQKLWVQTYDKAIEKYSSKGTAAAIAWSAVKKECYKDYKGIWQCAQLLEKRETEKRIKKLRSEAKRAKKKSRTGTETGDRYKRQRLTKKPKISEEELARRVRHLRS